MLYASGRRGVTATTTALCGPTERLLGKAFMAMSPLVGLHVLLDFAFCNRFALVHYLIAAAIGASRLAQRQSQPVMYSSAYVE